jgi:hypothetical protein
VDDAGGLGACALTAMQVLSRGTTPGLGPFAAAKCKRAGALLAAGDPLAVWLTAP